MTTGPLAGILFKVLRIDIFGNEMVDLEHFFFQCSKNKPILVFLFNRLNNLWDIRIPYAFESLEECVLFQLQIEGGGICTVLYYCILVANYYIYCQNIQKESATDFY